VEDKPWTNLRYVLELQRRHPSSSEQTLTRPFQLVPGAVLIANLSPPQEQSCGARLRDYCGFSVKNVKISLFTSVFTPDFTFSILNLLRERNMQNRNFESDDQKTTKTGGRRPHFFGFQPPKKFRGVAPARFVCYPKPHFEP
jgi:hypothetical protein